MNYRYEGKSQRFIRRGRMVDVDSALERRLIEWLDDHGYAEHLYRPKGGFGYGNFNDSWTPDLQLAVELHGKSTEIMVEVKPTLSHLENHLLRRLAKIAENIS